MDLRGLGLTDYEQRAYLAVLGRPTTTSRQLVATLSCSAATAGRLLDGLVAKGLVTVVAGSPARYLAISPSIAIESLARLQTERAQRSTELIPALMETYWAGQKEALSQDVIEVVSGPVHKVLHRSDQLHQAARSTVRTFDAPPYYDSTPVDWINPVTVDKLKDGIVYRTVYDHAAVADPVRWRDLEAGMAAGEQCRMAPTLPAKLMLIDDWVARVTLGSLTPDTLTLVVIHRSSLLDALSALFEEYWSRAIPLRPGDQSSQTDRQERLVALLSTGLSDSAIRRHLGISASTVQRSINALLGSVGASTRFQAGLQIGRRQGRQESS